MIFRGDSVKNRTFKTIIWILFCLYILLLIKVILFKYPIDMTVETLKGNNMDMFKKRILYSSNFIPFRTIYKYSTVDIGFNISVSNILGNIIAFMSLGFLLSLLKERLRELKKIFKIAFIISLTFEIIQLITGLGQFDVDDIILNVLGGVLGFLIYKIFCKIYDHSFVANKNR